MPTPPLINHKIGELASAENETRAPLHVRPFDRLRVAALGLRFRFFEAENRPDQPLSLAWRQCSDQAQKFSSAHRHKLAATRCENKPCSRTA